MPNIGCLISADKERMQEVEALLSYVCSRDRSWLYAHRDYELSAEEKSALESMLQRLNSGEPLAYILGFKDFYNIRFKVSPSVLIPRPETEIIVEEALAFAKRHPEASFFDIGTGSGAIIISIAANSHGHRYYAGDVSGPALSIARDNAQSVGVSIVFKVGGLLSPFTTELSSSRKIFIAANLPYLTPQERGAEPSIAQEPDLALIGGKDGLDLYRGLLEEAYGFLQGKSFQIMMEISPWQDEILLDIALSFFPQAEIKKMPDLSGRARFITVIMD